MWPQSSSFPLCVCAGVRTQPWLSEEGSQSATGGMSQPVTAHDVVSVTILLVQVRNWGGGVEL